MLGCGVGECAGLPPSSQPLSGGEDGQVLG